MTDVWPEGALFTKQAWHFHRRLYERYGFCLSPGAYSDIIRQIRRGNAIHIKCSVYAVSVKRRKKRQWIFVAYEGATIATALTPEPALKKRLQALLRLRNLTWCTAMGLIHSQE